MKREVTRSYQKLPEATTSDTPSTLTVTPTEFATPPNVEMDHGYGKTSRRGHADNREFKGKSQEPATKITRRRKNPKYNTDLINDLQNKILIEQEPATVLQQCFDNSRLIYSFFIHSFIQNVVFFTDSRCMPFH